ncbi:MULTISPECIES: hypothetical protein [Cyanophyceae]|uniref:hypothetical protein n=1 Tax=Cyanophyceae TaxID=3028117 RepID=UPI0016874E4D|nr:hypothetical protein [Trichocoleus sp. FACHB-69]MBD1930508.1 hypothetical protein [Trichocoleus sp. FACHB-69]
MQRKLSKDAIAQVSLMMRSLDITDGYWKEDIAPIFTCSQTTSKVYYCSNTSSLICWVDQCL